MARKIKSKKKAKKWGKAIERGKSKSNERKAAGQKRKEERMALELSLRSNSFRPRYSGMSDVPSHMFIHGNDNSNETVHEEKFPKVRSEVPYSNYFNEIYIMLRDRKDEPLPVSEREKIHRKLVEIENNYTDVTSSKYRMDALDNVSKIRALLGIEFKQDKKALQKEFLELLAEKYELPSLNSRNEDLMSPAKEINELRRIYGKVLFIKDRALEEITPSVHISNLYPREVQNMQNTLAECKNKAREHKKSSKYDVIDDAVDIILPQIKFATDYTDKLLNFIVDLRKNDGDNFRYTRGSFIGSGNKRIYI